MNDLTGLAESAPSILGFVLALFVLVFAAFLGLANMFGRLFKGQLEQQSENETTKPLLDALMALVNNNAAQLAHQAKTLENDEKRLNVILQEFGKASDERKISTDTARRTEDKTLQIVSLVSTHTEKLDEITATTKGGKTMLDQILEHLKLLEARMTKVEQRLIELPGEVADKVSITQELRVIATETAAVVHEVKELASASANGAKD